MINGGKALVTENQRFYCVKDGGMGVQLARP